ncbi:hypothetical protein N7495_008972 [Penicillium taxi]|uniref:uncharacterized protein n=1 Tax=Penicillium taxi TaxID=168475 RepID=UPI0025459864|nr:uncharacterized protein N7495_008972 [Penicillium taxi]KAJ5888931.1 hypothetical protein N7495_008972 [Penicillium taxi]
MDNCVVGIADSIRNEFLNLIHKWSQRLVISCKYVRHIVWVSIDLACQDVGSNKAARSTHAAEW